MAHAPSSPRLPSPPPPVEIPLGAASPSAGTQARQQMEQMALDANSSRRIHPGTKASDMAAGPPLVPLNELDSAFQLQEHLAALHYHHTAGLTKPMTRDTAVTLAHPPPATDGTLWLYELCRFLIAQCNQLIVGFLFDAPPCSAATCPEMRASEWQFLCAVHDAPKSCCAIDYCCHTLDWAANVVTNPKLFPSRFVAPASAAPGSVDAGPAGAAQKSLGNVMRRLHRMFAHAWFQHRGVFWAVEAHTGLYVLFKTVCDVYDLLPPENYKLPPEAEGLEATPTAPEDNAADPDAGAETRWTAPAMLNASQMFVPTAIAKPPGRTALGAAAADDDDDDEEEEDAFSPAGRTNTRRHIRNSPSTGSAVTTVIEADELDDETEVTDRMEALHVSPPETVPEEGGGEFAGRQMRGQHHAAMGMERNHEQERERTDGPSSESPPHPEEPLPEAPEWPPDAGAGGERCSPEAASAETTEAPGQPPADADEAAPGDTIVLAPPSDAAREPPPAREPAESAPAPATHDGAASEPVPESGPDSGSAAERAVVVRSEEVAADEDEAPRE
ncbi:hypothetical protein P8C59_001336 [Phyllachora maydis]|uniref:Mob1 family protein n=1 Tax=Phyllachora maydis TaxID=1825666 RepID=A0AAD9HY08_9PEZI|nr:hypothetical protein P8C59_001336 [Phyllachora maydis]